MHFWMVFRLQFRIQTQTSLQPFLLRIADAASMYDLTYKSQLRIGVQLLDSDTIAQSICSQPIGTVYSNLHRPMSKYTYTLMNQTLKAVDTR